jgi:flagellum-specific peptidoglycan hydrolase FlgJ
MPINDRDTPAGNRFATRSHPKSGPHKGSRTDDAVMVCRYRRFVAALAGTLLGLTAPVALTADPAAAKAALGRRVVLSADQRAFLESIAPAARNSQRRYGVPASVVIAQAVLETGWGTSQLAHSARNYFGMTCGPNGAGPIATGCYVGSDRVCDDTGCWPSAASFRVYGSLADSVSDHGQQLKTNRRYKAAYKARSRPETFVKRMAKAGYATDPGYGQRVIRIMKKYKLNKYDKK